MWSRVKTYPVRQKKDIKEFFDQIAYGLDERHGDRRRLLNHRMRLIRKVADLKDDDLILEIGCGKARHLRELFGANRRGIGIDISEAMIEEAIRETRHSPFRNRVSFRVDEGEKLLTIEDSSVDLALCVGALEHFIDKKACILNAFRVLKKGGRFVCLTQNGGSIYYQLLSPIFKVSTKHLSTDSFLTKSQARDLLDEAGFRCLSIGFWSFIPKGDISPLMGYLLQILDVVGSIVHLNMLRGGLFFAAQKP